LAREGWTRIGSPGIPACPPWCTLPAGHGFYGIEPSGAVVRVHEQLDAGDVGVFLIAQETAATDEGPVLTTVLRIELDLGTRRVTGPDARQLAAALLNSADEWDRIMRLKGLREGTTIRTWRGCLERLAQAVGGDLHAVTDRDLSAWQRGLTVGPQSHNTYVAHVQEFYRWAVADGLLDADPTGRLVGRRSRGGCRARSARTSCFGRS